MLRLAAETYYLYRRNIRIWMLQPIIIIPPLFITAFFFVVFSAGFDGLIFLPEFPTDDYQAFLTPMIVVQAIIFTSADAGLALITDMLSGYLDKLLLAPINRLSILAGHLLVAATRGLLQGLVVILIAFAFGVSFETGALGVIVLLLASSVFGLIWSCLSLLIALKTRSAQAMQASFIIFFPFVFITTAFLPVELLGGWFEVAVKLNPVTYVMDALRALVIDGWDWSTILPGFWVLAGGTLIFVTWTTWMFRKETA